MHYYQFNIGDYARDTSHLSLVEHGIYRLLLDWCYLNEKPITTEKALRVGRGFPTETQSVLSEFFVGSDEGWEHPRVKAEIEQFRKKAETNRKNGLKGGRPKTQNNPAGFQSQPNRNPNQEPITNNQEPSKPLKPKTAPATPLPDWLDAELWADFKAHRIASKSKMTPRAEALALADLARLKADGHNPHEVIKQSIMRGWKGLFALNGHDHAKGKSRHEQHADFVAELTGRNKRKPADDPSVIHGTAERVD